MSPECSDPAPDDGDTLGDEHHHTPTEMLAAILADLAERTRYLDSLLAELAQSRRLQPLLAQLEERGHRHALAELLVNLVERTDQLDVRLANLATSHDYGEALAALRDHGDQVNALVTELERIIDQASHEL